MVHILLIMCRFPYGTCKCVRNGPARLDHAQPAQVQDSHQGEQGGGHGSGLILNIIQASPLTLFPFKKNPVGRGGAQPPPPPSNSGSS